MPTRGDIKRLGEELRHNPTPDVIGRYLDYRESFASDLDEIRSEIGRILPEYANQIDGRLKTADTVIAKLAREPKMDLSRMQDIAGCRLVVDSLAEQDSVVGKLQATFPAATTYDHRHRPHSGYRAIHIVMRSRAGNRVEVQVRTRLQDRWAQLSERAADLFGLDVKYGAGPTKARTLLDNASADVARMEEAERRMTKIRQIRPSLNSSNMLRRLSIAVIYRVLARRYGFPWKTTDSLLRELDEIELEYANRRAALEESLGNTVQYLEEMG